MRESKQSHLGRSVVVDVAAETLNDNRTIEPVRTVSRSHVLKIAASVAAVAPLASCVSARLAYDAAADTMRRPLARSNDPRLARELVRYATLAPSSHNTQPWRFTLGPRRISISPDLTRRCPAVDPDDHHLFVSLGCAAENLVLAALARGLHGDPRFDRVTSTVHVAFVPTKATVSTRFEAIPARQCTRSTYDGHAVPTTALRSLEAAGAGTGMRALMFTSRRDLERILGYVVRANTTQMNDPAFVSELREWIRFNERDAIASGDGLSSLASGNPQVPRWLGDIAFRYSFTTKHENDAYAASIRSSAGIAVFVSDADDRAAWVETGRCYERFVLQATALGIRSAMINQPVEVASIREEFARSLGVAGRRPGLVVRFGYGAAMPQSMRRPIDDVIV